MKNNFFSRFFPLKVAGQPGFNEDPSGKRRWRLLQVESAIVCNLDCLMCPWREITKNPQNRGLMSDEVWAAIRPYLSEVNSVDFTGGGEPLLQPKLEEWTGWQGLRVQIAKEHYRPPGRPCRSRPAAAMSVITCMTSSSGYELRVTGYELQGICSNIS